MRDHPPTPPRSGLCRYSSRASCVHDGPVRGQSHHRARSDQNRRPHPGHTHTIPNNGGGNKHRCTAERVTNLPNPAGPAPPPTPPPPPHDPQRPAPPWHIARNSRRTGRRKSSSRRSAAADPAETHGSIQATPSTPSTRRPRPTRSAHTQTPRPAADRIAARTPVRRGSADRLCQTTDQYASPEP